MPKLPLDRETLKLLPGLAIGAVRHPRRTASQALSGSITVVGQLLERRPATEPVPGMASPPPVAVEPDESEPPGPVAAEPAPPEATVEDTVEDLAPTAEPDQGPDVEAAPGPEPLVESLDEDASDLDEGPTDTRPEGPAPHMPPRIAGDVERDYEEDIPGITPARHEP